MLILDRMNELTDPDPLYSFALDEILCKHTGNGGPAICHLWRHPHSFIMGLRDSRLPHANQGRQWVASQGYQVGVRNSGGAAVPLDLGVVNISLIIPKQGQGDMHFHRDFERMYRLIQTALLHTGSQVDKGEIQGAYCPGDFDLSIAGRKFCGIAQRRQAHAYIVQAFVIVDGTGQDRAQLVQGFYERAAFDADSSQYPIVTDGSTASLVELTAMGKEPITNFTEAVKRVIREQQISLNCSSNVEDVYLPTTADILEMASTLRHRYDIDI
ncbi:ligase [Paenibacillus crassostreae]|uniref:Ligase n=2 Tax=Paenibacillus crassostreae TaxID=1763538 RepID=A0A167BHV7_9BACL|nr:ligase [Paenibacillus crassostreae]AOZ94706.1 ligase [Paenibacillus crassostreae]OAB72082.1 ligase [Paenibacillus crassostreae]